ncbi:MAG: SMP-30/gluconolactonase/LRE family protein [Acidobacteria bacterium]|nr:SMP-30/gluconolactonase/LRE family protein [Acidobacteriota bacterium]
MKKIIILFSVILLILSVFGQASIYDDFVALYQKAVKHTQAGDFQAALESYNKMLELSPNSTGVNYQIARMNMKLGKEKEAVSALRKSLEMGVYIEKELAPELSPLLENPANSELLTLFQDSMKPVNTSTVAFTVPGKDLIPEGMAYDPVENCFYLGSIFKRKILKIDRNGKVTEFKSENQDGLQKVLGMTVDAKRHHLWVVNMIGPELLPGIQEEMRGWSAIFKYDLKNGDLLNRYILWEKGVIRQMNDVTIMDNGDAYVTDSEYKAVYRIPADTDKPELFLKPDEFAYPNGITKGADENTLYMSNEFDGIYRIDIKTKKLTLLPHPDDVSLSGVDGMYFYKNSLVCVQNGLNRISRFYLDKTGDRVEKIEVLETRNPNFIIPTTGAIAGDTFYYIANSQLGAYKPDGSLIPEDQRKDIVILKTQLK